MTARQRYLWDRTGEPDPETVRLERLLGELRYEPTRDARRALRRRRMRAMPLAAAAAILLVAGGAWLLTRSSVLSGSGGWTVATLIGSPTIDSVPLADGGRLRIGQWIETDAGSRARVEVANIGHVTLDPESRVRLIRSNEREHRLALDRGTIHALIYAPPRLFFVDTPAAVAVDLGCAYTLEVNEAGAGMLSVTSGWVSFERDGRDSRVPRGASCRVHPQHGPGTPFFDDASPGFREALQRLDEGVDDPGALDAILSESRRRDALSLWHLLTKVDPKDRERIVDGLEAFNGPLAEEARAKVLALDRDATQEWWASLRRSW